jgi:Uma2 family endonuclease
MSVALRSPKRWTVEDYLRFEETAVERHELVDGVIYAMVGGTDVHDLITGNLFLALGNHLPDRCQVFEHGMKLRVRVERSEDFFYPDVMVSCREEDRAKLYREQPVLLAEVLSQSTERADRTDKFMAYKTIAELQEYILIAQDVPQVEMFRRRNAWQVETFFMKDTIHLESVDLMIPVPQLYRRIKFS